MTSEDVEAFRGNYRAQIAKMQEASDMKIKDQKLKAQEKLKTVSKKVMAATQSLIQEEARLAEELQSQWVVLTVARSHGFYGKCCCQEEGEPATNDALNCQWHAP